MGWKGTVRSVNSTFKAMDRDAQRYKREKEKRAKAVAKLQELERAAFEVEEFEAEVARLTSQHKLGTPLVVDWNEIFTISPPSEPVFTSNNKQRAEQVLESYRPNFLDKTLKRVDKKMRKLAQAIEVAEQADLQEFQDCTTHFNEEQSNWEQSISISKRILNHDTKAYIEAINELNPFVDLAGLIDKLGFHAHSEQIVSVSSKVNLEQTIPSKKKGLLQSGKLSIKQMPKSQHFELCQDFVCSCALRIARDILGILPIEWVLVNISQEMLNSTTGMLQDQIILSVAIPRETLSKINLNAIDPSDSMKNFKHNMIFKKTKGFDPVELISLDDIASSSV